MPNIRVNAICPSFTDTAMGRKALLVPLAKTMIEGMGGLMATDRVTNGMVQLIENEALNGKVMRILPHVSDYHKFPKL